MHLVIKSDTSLLDALHSMNQESSKNTLRSWLEKGRVLVNGELASKGNMLLKPGDKVTLGAKSFFLRKGIRVLFEDKHLVVIDKPEGLLSVATDFEENLTVHNILKRRFNKQQVFPVHRLDRETSGVLVFAYTERAREFLKDKFQKHDIVREYIAIVEGRLESKQGSWSSYLYEDPQYKVKSVSQEKGKMAVTHYQVIKEMARTSMLRIRLETGRKNQIRVHCSEAHHPIVGDEKYGSLINPLKRLGLHAHKLGFIHPVTGKQLLFESPVPAVFNGAKPVPADKAKRQPKRARP
jgi:23S rRNA pseudouridine1911/1915/1917 synthase